MSTPGQEFDWWEDRASSVEAARAAIWDERESNESRVARLADLVVPALRPVLHRDARVLDLGCGIGDLTRALARDRPTMKFIGVDISAAMLGIARTLSRPNIRWVQGDGRTLPRVGRLNGAWSVLTFQHIPAEAQRGYVREVAERLEPGGIFRLQWVTCCDQVFLSNGVPDEQMRDWCEEAGLKVDTIEGDDWCDSWAWMTAVKP